MEFTAIYARVMLFLAVVGFVINIVSIILLCRKTDKSMFHTLLKVLAVYDLVVILGCTMLYSLPEIWTWFTVHVYPFCVPWLLPAVQIAMMTSVYCTVLMSFERYIRICHLCQLKSSKALTEDNFSRYVLAFVVCPVLFYLPKFFEIRTTSVMREHSLTLNCSWLRPHLQQQADNRHETVKSFLSKVSLSERNLTTVRLSFSPRCLNFNFSLGPDEDMMRNLTRVQKALEIAPTPLRRNAVYYKVYCIAMNTLFASLVPLVSLIFLNIRTVIALRAMGRASSPGLRVDAFPLVEVPEREAASAGNLRRSLSLLSDTAHSEVVLSQRSRTFRVRALMRPWAAGVIEKLGHLEELTVDSLWLSPFYAFGGSDMGFDVLNHTEVDDRFGSMQDIDNLIGNCSSRGIRLIIDFIPNHTSNQSEWFSLSESRDPAFEDFYVWANASNPDFAETGADPQPPNNWKCLGGISAWTWSDTRGQYYLHNFLQEMPDLNLKNPSVVEKLQDTMRFWLNRGVFGFRIGAFNVLIEDLTGDEDYVISDVAATRTFLEGLRNVTLEYTQRDNIERLFLLEMVEGEHLRNWQEIYRNATFDVAVIPYSFGSLPFATDLESVTGDLVYKEVLNYVQNINSKTQGRDWPCWGLTSILGEGSAMYRIRTALSQMLTVMALLLPGTVVMYYGDEIGMENGDPSEIRCALTQDPYVLPPYANCSGNPELSRDPARMPMQWTNETNAGFSDAEADATWLPVSNSYKDINVELERGKIYSSLELFRNLTQQRDVLAFYDGDVYFPYHDENVFSFMRKIPDDTVGYLVVANIKAVKDPATVIVDFLTVSPGMPATATVVLVTTNYGQAPQHNIGDEVDLSAVQLFAYECIVLMLDYAVEPA